MTELIDRTHPNDEIQSIVDKYYQQYPRLKTKDTFNIVKIEDNVFAFTGDWKNIISFDDKNAKSKIVLSYFRDADYAQLNWEKIEIDFFQKALRFAWYKEIYNEQIKTYEMYKKTLINWREWYKKIDNVFSKEYYQAWVNIDWHFDRVVIETTLLWDKWQFFKFNSDVIKLYLDKWSIRLKEIIQMKRQGQIDDNTYQAAVKYFKENLLIKQLWDDRFFNSLRTDPAKKMTYEDWLQEVTEYKNEWIITQEEFKECTNQLDELKQKWKIRLREIDKTKEHTQNELKNLKTWIA